MASVLSIRSPRRGGSRGGASAWGGEVRLVVLDDGRSLLVDAEQIARHGIAAGEALADDLVERLEARGHYVRARDTAVRLLAARPRSIAELRSRLRRAGVAGEHIRTVIEDLLAAGYLGDLAFARAWVSARLARRPCGTAQLRRELRDKGVATALAEQAITEAYGEEDISVAEERNARALVARRLRVYSALSQDARIRRIAGFLDRRGFSPATITRVLRTVGRRVPSEMPE